jgi:circadian clock protein KaiC
MNSKKSPQPTSNLLKARTGIEGFDEITYGGLPRGRTTLLEGGPGSGKTIMALQSLVHGARYENEPGIFVAFEESSERVLSNAEKFGWDLPDLQKKNLLFFLDAQPAIDVFQSGSFDLGGMLAALQTKVREIKAKRIVFDSVDVVLVLLNDSFAERREVYRLHEWLLAQGLTALITAKVGGHGEHTLNQPQLSFMQFMVDCSVVLKQELAQGVSQRSLRVVKYRGSSFSENESPILIGNTGLEVAVLEMGRLQTKSTSERLSSGVSRLDVMLGGGYYRGATILITGFPGTAKSTLSGAFVEAACRRGERTLFVSFDLNANEVVRNLASVSIGLDRFVKKGILRLVSERTITGSAEIHLMKIKNIAREHGSRCVVIDPVSALWKSGNEGIAHSVAERLIDWSKAAEITLLCTSLQYEAGPQAEITPMQISTMADTWIHLNYLVNAGERNRGLSIIKSRGSAHSNQVRELVLNDKGVTLADAYTAGGEVVMGTMRWEKERAVLAALENAEVIAKTKRAALETEEAELEIRLQAVQRDLHAKRAEKQASTHLAVDQSRASARGRTQLSERRGVDKI